MQGAEPKQAQQRGELLLSVSWWTQSFMYTPEKSVFPATLPFIISLAV